MESESTTRAAVRTALALFLMVVAVFGPVPRATERSPAPPPEPGVGALAAPPPPEGTADPPALPVEGDAGVAELTRPRVRSVSDAPSYPRLRAGLDATSAVEVVPRRPRLRVDGLVEGALGAALQLEGVAFATIVHTDRVAVRVPGGEGHIDLALVEPGGFRVFTPGFTARTDPLWDRVAQGEVALTWEAGRRLGVRPGEEIVLGDGPGVRVAGWASLGDGAEIDAVASVSVLGAAAPAAQPTMLVGVHRAGAVGAVAEALQVLGEVHLVPERGPYVADIVGDDPATVAAFEPFTFHHRGGGRIVIDQGWVDRNIVDAEVPILGEVRCHRLLIPQLRAALADIEARGLAGLLDPGDYGGCYLPRHIGWDEGRSLSMHAWGLAVDANVQSNLMGRPPQLDPRIVEVFEQWGFNWGGRWRNPDGMHFELGQLLDLPT